MGLLLILVGSVAFAWFLELQHKNHNPAKLFRELESKKG